MTPRRLPPLPELWTVQELAVWADRLLEADGPQSRVLGQILARMLRVPDVTLHVRETGTSASAKPPYWGMMLVVVCTGHQLGKQGPWQDGPACGAPPTLAWCAQHWSDPSGGMGTTSLALRPWVLDLVEDEEASEQHPTTAFLTLYDVLARLVGPRKSVVDEQ